MLLLVFNWTTSVSLSITTDGHYVASFYLRAIMLLLVYYIFQVARGGQSVTLVGSKLIMFGGEDQHRRLLNDISVLDLETMTWSTVETM